MNALFRWAAPLSTVVALGCNSPVDDAASSERCEPNPELSVQPRRISFNGESMNRISFNGVSTNRISFNGENLNRISFNGSNLNRISFNGMQLNRISFNGIALNGENLEGLRRKDGAVNELVAMTEEGQVVGGEALVGAKLEGILSSGASIELTVSAFERGRDGLGLAHYTLTHEGQSICEDADDKGIFLPGVWDESGARRDRADANASEIAVTYSCMKGVIAKCVAWGYVPWTVGVDLHQTCTRMARADYCGNGVSWTKDDTLIDVFDTRGIQVPTAGDASFAFEAGWGTQGAVCVNRTRYTATTLAGEAKMPSCWGTLPKCGSFEEAKAAGGATIGNGSKIQSRVLCE